MPLGYVAVDRDWRITYVNGEGEAVLGRTWDQLVGACYWRSFPFAVDTEFGRTYREVVATGTARTVEAFYPEPLDRWFEVRAVPRPDGLALYFSEVTARRRSEEHTSELQSRQYLVCRLLLEKKKTKK